MPKKKYYVHLSAKERMTLEQLLRRGKAGIRKLIRARILLQAHDGLSDEEIAIALAVGTATVRRMRQRFVEAPRGPRRVHLPWGTTQVERPAGSTRNCGSVYTCPRGPHPLDPAAAGGEGGQDGFCRLHIPRDSAPGAQKSECKAWHQQWCWPEVTCTPGLRAYLRKCVEV